MSVIVPIVEGDGEVKALPLLLRRIAEAQGRFDLTVAKPIRVHRDRFLRRDEEMRRILVLAEQKAAGGTVLVLLDADDDCPVVLARDVAERANSILHAARLAVVIAQREYESWFLAAAESLAGRRGLPTQLDWPPNSETIRDAKGWLGERIRGGGYHPVSDQPGLTQLLDVELAKSRSRSFRKFVKECEAALMSGVGH